MDKGKGKGKNSVVLPSGLFGLKICAGVSQVDVDVKKGHFDAAPDERLEDPDVELDLQAVRGPDKRSELWLQLITGFWMMRLPPLRMLVEWIAMQSTLPLTSPAPACGLRLR